MFSFGDWPKPKCVFCGTLGFLALSLKLPPGEGNGQVLAEVSLWALTVCIYSVHRSELLAYGCLLTSTVKHTSLSQTGQLSPLFISISLMPAPPRFTSCLSCGFPDGSSLVLCHLFPGLPLVPFRGLLPHLSPPCLLYLSVRLVRHK